MGAQATDDETSHCEVTRTAPLRRATSANAARRNQGSKVPLNLYAQNISPYYLRYLHDNFA